MTVWPASSPAKRACAASPRTLLDSPVTVAASPQPALVPAQGVNIISFFVFITMIVVSVTGASPTTLFEVDEFASSLARRARELHSAAAEFDFRVLRFEGHFFRFTERFEFVLAFFLPLGIVQSLSV